MSAVSTLSRFLTTKDFFLMRFIRTYYRELKKWIAIRENELREEEEFELIQEEEKMNKKIQSDIELVARKLNEETIEKRQRVTLEMKEKCRVRSMS